jgi:hypothetical protein
MAHRGRVIMIRYKMLIRGYKLLLYLRLIKVGRKRVLGRNWRIT